jgi:hypothetical protein
LLCEFLTAHSSRRGNDPDKEPCLNPFDLTGRVAIVTGGNGGLGLGMARGLARAGAAMRRATKRKVKPPSKN